MAKNVDIDTIRMSLARMYSQWERQKRELNVTDDLIEYFEAKLSAVKCQNLPLEAPCSSEPVLNPEPQSQEPGTVDPLRYERGDL